MLLLEEQNRALATLRKATLYGNTGSSGNLKKGNALSEHGEFWQPYNRQCCLGDRGALDTNVLSLLSSVFRGLKQMARFVKRARHKVIQLRDKIFVQKRSSTYWTYWRSSLPSQKTCCYDGFLIVFLSTFRRIEKYLLTYSMEQSPS